MLNQLIQDALKRKNLSIREAARQIGISHSTLTYVLEGKTMEVHTADKICKWLGVPLSAAVESDDQLEKAIAAISVVLKAAPELEKVFIEAADEVNNGTMTIQDFHEIIEYAAYRIQKRKEASLRNVG
jgi:transcriptional regulator with XRE-family HTH domain